MDGFAKWMVLNSMQKEAEAAAGSQAPQSVLSQNAARLGAAAASATGTGHGASVAKPPVVKPPNDEPNLVQQPVVRAAPPPTTGATTGKRETPEVKSAGKSSGKLPIQPKIKMGAGSAKPDRKKLLIKEAWRIYHAKYPDHAFEQFRKEYMTFWSLHSTHKQNVRAGTSTNQKPPHFWPIVEIIASKDSTVKSHDYGRLTPAWCIKCGFMKSNETVGGGSSSKKQRSSQKTSVSSQKAGYSSDSSSSAKKVKVKKEKKDEIEIDSDDSEIEIDSDDSDAE